MASLLKVINEIQNKTKRHSTNWIIMSTVQELMAKTVITIDLQKTIFNTAVLMNERKVGCLVILDGVEPVGIVTERDFVRRVLATSLPFDTPVSAIMSTPLITIEPEASLRKAARVMVKHSIRRLPVIKEKQLIGILVVADFARYLDEEIITDEILEAMARSPLTVVRRVVNTLYVITGIILALMAILVVTWISRENPQLILFVKDLILQYGYIGVFLATVIAGTILPFGSPLVVAWASGFGLPFIPLILVATSGFTVGVTTCYLLAYGLREKFISNRMSPETFESLALKWNQKGYWVTVLLSLVPGFPLELLALVCGIFQTKLWVFIPLCWVTLVLHFTVYAVFGQYLGSWIL
jgi:CBS domain-containing protein/membrane protein YqaA with SNARE-associated domain